MAQTVTLEGNGFQWIDLVNPSREDLEEIGKTHELHQASIEDCLQPEHLPKFEQMKEYAFIIFRICEEKETSEADTVRELTNKVAIFYSSTFIITVHRCNEDLFDTLKVRIKDLGCQSSFELLNLLVYACLYTYEKPLAKLSKSVDHLEEVVFLRPRKVPLLRSLYFLKRQIDLLRRMLILSREIIEAIDAKEGNVKTRDTRDQYVRFQIMFDALSENINQLLNVYFSASSQRTNEIIRVLTIFSVFFMPLTFIVGIYGMNFKHMPELQWTLGYPASIALMAGVTLLIYIWFKRKKWL